MRNLALQGEVRHALPLGFHREHHDRYAISGKIVAVIRNTSADGHRDVDINDGRFDYDQDHANDSTAVDESYQEGEDFSSLQLSKQPPEVFVMTSEGKLLALDGNDRLVWMVDLEKVALESSAEQDDEGGADASSASKGANDTLSEPRSEWFYAAGFLQEESPEASNTHNADAILGLNINDRARLHVTCLSHAGHVVSVSIDSTNSVVSRNGSPEDGSECIGTFMNGLECGGWSPDGEVLALITFASEDEEGNALQLENDELRLPILMTMNTHYEILAEVRLEPCLYAGNHSNNNSNNGTSEEAIHPNAISFCWRPDSSSLAVSTMDANAKTTNENSESNPLRRIRTFSRTTLQLLSLSKEEDGSGRDVPNLLPVSPTWASAGCSHYVGAVQSSRSMSSKTSVRGRPISMQVAFMEPNGLRHRECKIHMTYDRMKEKEEVVGVVFNLDGELLAVTSLVTPLTSASQSEQKPVCMYGKLQLYHRSNYHWYLKYELRYGGHITSSSSAIISKVKFSEEDPYQIMVALDRRHIVAVNTSFHALEWREYAFRWDSSTIYYRNNPTGKDSSVLAMAIDGKTLHMTPLDKAIIPPPMYASSLEFPAPVVGIATRPSFFHELSSRPDENRVEFLVTMSDGKFALLNFGLCGNGISLTPGFSPPSIVATADLLPKISSDHEMGIGHVLEGTALRDIAIIDANNDSFTVIAVSSPKATRGNYDFFENLIEMDISWNTSSDSSHSPIVEITITASLPLREGRALRIVNWSDTAFTERARGSALLELFDGALFSYSQGGMLEPLGLGHLLEPCPWVVGLFDPHADVAVSSTAVESYGRGESSNPFVIGLSSRYRLYCGERLISSATSSFGVSLQHRFLTHITLGSRPQMRFLPLANLRDFDPLMGSDENTALDGYEPRSVERGSRLVALLTNSPSVVVQMPRGNLESMSPRALALPYVMTKIRERDYSTALDIMRRQRIDTNLIVDFDAKDFLENGGAEAFLDQIVKIDNINLFLSSLIDVDTTLWKYPVPSWLRAENQPAYASFQNIEVPSKVNRVCAKMREIMLNAEKNGATLSGKMVTDGHFLLPILSTFAKEVPPRLEDALTLIKSTAHQVQLRHQRKTSVLLSDHVQNSIQYLAFLADYELIFNTAIGMYDFDLAKAVARHSQMDPKVYLPLLQRWRSIPDSAARFEVDVKLNRFESALRHLVSLGENEEPTTHFEKCLNFIENHKLHRLGLELFMNNASFTRAIMLSLGESFMRERKFEEALTVFLSSDPKYSDGAKRAAFACGDWRTYFICCSDAGEVINNDQVTSIAEGISSKLGSPKQQREAYAAAARILLDYGHDVACAIDMLIAAQMWFEARRISHKHNRTDLLKKCVDAAASYAASCIEDFSERASTFETTNDRFAEVIVLRRDAIKIADETGALDHHDDSASLFSMQSTASNSSLRSTASGASIGSIGSVASVSTVISIGAKSTFQFTGDRDILKHKSKFNKIGRDRVKKKKKKDGPAAKRTKPGSEEHLKELVLILTNTCPDEDYVDVVSETINFLLQSGKQPLAKCLFEAYHELEASVSKSQIARLDRDKVHRHEKEMLARKEGLTYEHVEHPCEKEVSSLCCKSLPTCVENVMSYLLI
ncbi:hypothetical protein ACHAW6_011976 [Cyclotella cf. meneghiniana]